MIEVSEFPEMAQRYHIYGVPKTVINDQVEFEGGVPEQVFVRQVLSAVQGGGERDEGEQTDETPS